MKTVNIDGEDYELDLRAHNGSNYAMLVARVACLLALLLSSCDGPTTANGSQDLATMCERDTADILGYRIGNKPDPCVAYWLRKIYERMDSNGGKQ